MQQSKTLHLNVIGLHALAISLHRHLNVVFVQKTKGCSKKPLNEILSSTD